jgi:hypothetical protein
MKLLWVVLFLMVAGSANATKVQATVATGTTSCGFTLDSGAVVVVAASGTLCLFDVSAVAPGAHVVTADARTTDPLWSTSPSAQSVPLNFSRPVPPAAPTGLVLVP